MVNFKRLTDRAKDVVEKRGGSDALKADAQELRKIASGQGSIKEKAMAAKDALKDPGARRGASGAGEGRAERPGSGPEATVKQEQEKVRPPKGDRPASPGGIAGQGAGAGATEAPAGGSASPDTPEGPRSK
jgi:hypothetical protein